MKDALAKGAQAGSAECAVTEDRCADAMTRAERALAEVLADVLRADRLSVDSHFFDQLGADSLVMARFCARVRKRGDLPSVSMKDIYRHPTIRSLAGVLWRLMGVRVGRRVFDDGTHISEPTLTTIGDEAILNYRSKIQCHSQEDGTFKCDRTTVGAGCTIGVGAFILYGVTMGDGSALAADSFLMKGEYVPARARWAGNPAREV